MTYETAASPAATRARWTGIVFGGLLELTSATQSAWPDLWQWFDCVTGVDQSAARKHFRGLEATARMIVLKRLAKL